MSNMYSIVIYRININYRKDYYCQAVPDYSCLFQIMINSNEHHIIVDFNPKYIICGFFLFMFLILVLFVLTNLAKLLELFIFQFSGAFGATAKITPK